jgi:N-acetylmuramoyl-L-alanine amidase
MRAFFQTYPGCRAVRIAVALLVLLLCPQLLHAGTASPAERAVSNPTSRSDLHYKAAKDFYYQLERDPEVRSQRGRWLEGVRNFRRLYLANQQASIAPSCLYMMARMYQRMYQLFSLPIDRDEALGYFDQLVKRFPRSNLADDALFTMAEIEEKTGKDPGRAADLYQKILDTYPHGDKSSQAASRLKKLVSTHDIKLPEPAPGKPRTASPKPVTILPLQHWSSEDYTRIVVRATGPVHYTSRLLEKNNNLPRRLYIDLNQSYLPPADRAQVPIEDGLLKQIRTGQVDGTTVRVTLDIESISDYKIYSLKDPFRLIVDVHGKKKKAAASTTKQPTAPPRLVHISPAEKKTPPQLTAPPRTGEKMSAEQEEQQPVVLVLKDSKKVRPSGKTRASEMPEDTGPTLSLAQQLGLGVRRIVIDPGHGGKDPGAMAFGLKEKDITLSVARRTARLLKQRYGYEVILTRDRDNYISLEERTAIANTNNADLFVSIHVNAHPKKTARGVETFFLNLATNTEAMRVAARENATSTHNISELQDILADLMQNAKIRESSQLAEFVQTSLVAGLEKNRYTTRNLGVKQAPFYVLIGASMPAVLAEISFITNPEESRRLKTSSYLDAIAEQIAKGVATYVDYRRTAALKM